MKRVLLLLASVTTYSALAQQTTPAPTTTAAAPPAEAKPRTVKQLETENEWLKAQLDAALKTHVADAKTCWSDDLSIVQSRYDAAVAQKKAAAALAKMQAPQVQPAIDPTPAADPSEQ